jgi:hypothetical protein
MSKAPCFFNLPTEIASDIFSQRLDCKDVLNLDTALLNRYQRQMFMDMVHDDRFVLRGSEDLVLSSYLQWLSYRKLKVHQVALTRAFLDETDQVAKLDLSKLESLSFRNNCGSRCKPTELSFMERLWQNFTVKPDPYMTIFVRCANLKHIDFGEEAHTAFGKIGMFCAKLQSVRAVHCKGLNDTAIENIAQHCRDSIRSVTLRACDFITSASVYAIADNCPNLTYIDLSYGHTLVSERCLIHLAEHCPQLEHINFEGLRNISDQVITTVARHCTNLAYFNIDYYKGMSHDGINPVALQVIAQSCPKITDFIAPDFNYKVRQGRATLKLKGAYTRLPKLQNILLHSPVTVSTFVGTGRSLLLLLPKRRISYSDAILHAFCTVQDASTSTMTVSPWPPSATARTCRACPCAAAKTSRT